MLTNYFDKKDENDKNNEKIDYDYVKVQTNTGISVASYKILSRELSKWNQTVVFLVPQLVWSTKKTYTVNIQKIRYCYNT